MRIQSPIWKGTGAPGILACLLLAAMWVPAGASAQDQAERLAALKARGAAASFTLFPVKMTGKYFKNFAEVLGLFYEKAGMENLEIANAAFKAPPGTDFNRAGALFGAFVRKNPIQTDYALYAEFCGTRKTGIQEVRFVIVDRTGALVWLDRQKPGDPDFKRFRPRNPMTCCVLAAHRFRAKLGLPESSATPGREGKMARLWDRKSGLPTREETAAMKPRRETLRRAGKSMKLLLFPVQIGKDVDLKCAKHLAEMLGEHGLCLADVAATAPRFDLKPTPNEQRRLWDLARAFRNHVRKHPPEADYVLFAEYMLHPVKEKVHAVHFVVCDRAGEWVIVDFQNEYQPDFKSLEPRTRADCDRLVVKRLNLVPKTRRL